MDVAAHLDCWNEKSAQMTTSRQGELLEKLLEGGGVEGAAFVSARGEILDNRAAGRDLTVFASMLGSCLASNRLLTELLGADVASQTTLSFASGTLLLTRAPSSDESGAASLVLLTNEDEVDRVRFGLRRLLLELSLAEADPA